MKIIFILSLFALTAVPLFAQNDNEGFELSAEKINPQFLSLLDKNINDSVYKNITSIVIIKEGKLFFEKYFDGYTGDSLHDTRSVGKTITSALTGIAINGGYLNSASETLGGFYDLKKFDNYSPAKETVTIKNLLTMSSGFLGFDFDENSPGNEENMYPQADWVKWTLNLPLDSTKTPGSKWEYFTAGIVVLGDILNSKVPGGLEKYADEKLFRPLIITKYRWEYTPQNVPNTAGGLRLSSLSLAKFGQLYKNKGVWSGKQILPEKWVNETFTKHFELPFDNMAYGYLWWNKNYNYKGGQYEVFACSGNGGNKIFVFTGIPVVAVITSTAYNKPYAHRQADKIVEDIILPAVLEVK